MRPDRDREQPTALDEWRAMRRQQKARRLLIAFFIALAIGLYFGFQYYAGL